MFTGQNFLKIILIMSVERLLFLSAITTIIIPGVNAGLLELSISDRSSVSERTMKSILESCYYNDSLADTVFVVGDFNEITDKLPMVRMELEASGPYQLPIWKATKVIIIVDSIHHLLADIRYLKAMSTWNHMASFFLIGKEEQSCHDHYIILREVWRMGMINSIYICPETMNTSVLYMLNQYANYAPRPWEIVEGSSGHTVFSQRFDENVSCSSLIYDKTIKLNGSTVKVMAWVSRDMHSEPQGDEWLMKNSVPSKLISAAAEVLNISTRFSFQTGRHITMERLLRGELDLMYYPSRIDEFPTIKFLFPYSQNRIVAMIKSSPEKLTQQKILHLRGFSVIFLAFTALAILFSILSWKNHGFSSASFGSSILTNTRSNLFRIFSTIILIMMIIGNGIFQGKMATFLRTYEEKEPIKSIATLVQLGYEFYCTPEVELHVKLHCPECQASTVGQNECFKYVLEGGLTACLTEESIYPHFDFMPLDSVEESLSQTLMVTKCRHDWPLYDRMNDIWIRFFESGLQKFWDTQQAYKSLLERRVQNTERSSSQYQPLKLHELLFAFEFLAIGLSLSTLVFIVELLVKKYQLSSRHLPILWRWL